MGSYASIFYYDSNDQCKFVALFNHKFFGYIGDEEYEQTLSYKYLMLNWRRKANMPNANVAYVGAVCEMTFADALQFMALYTSDFAASEKISNCSKYFGWDFCEIPKSSKQKVILAFD